jgi:hypothetical protein
MKDMKKRQLKFIGHILGKGKIEHTMTTDNIIGRQDREEDKIM